MGEECLLLELHSEVRIRRFVQLSLGSHNFMQASPYFLVLDLNKALASPIGMPTGRGCVKAVSFLQE